MSKLPARDSTNKITATIEALLDSVIANKFGDDPEDMKQGVEQYLEQVDAKHNNAAWQSLLLTYKDLEAQWEQENTGGETKREDRKKHQAHYVSRQRAFDSKVTATPSLNFHTTLLERPYLNFFTVINWVETVAKWQ